MGRLPKDRQEIRIYSGRLFPWQQATVKFLNRFDRQGVIAVILAPRQIGKTFMVEMVALARTINKKNYRVAIVNPTFGNARKTFDELAGYLKKLPPEITESCNASTLTIKLANGSSIVFKSAEQGDAARGTTADLLVLDEAAFMDTNVAMSVFFPYCNATRGNILIISTPKFKDEQNLFYKFYKMSKEHDRNESVMPLFDWTKYDTSAILTPERKAMLKEVMPLNIYMNEIEGEFLTEQSEVFGDFSGILRNGVLSTPNMVAGLDWASTGSDYTVLSIFNQNRQMYSLVRLNSQKSSSEQVDIILNAIKENNVKKVVYEANSIGSPMADFLKKKALEKHVQCQFIPFDTSNKSKREIIENLALNINNQTISLLDDNQLKLQFAQYQMQRTKTGLITYNNSSDNIHDDIVIATALALTAFNKGNYSLK